MDLVGSGLLGADRTGCESVGAVCGTRGDQFETDSSLLLSLGRREINRTERSSNIFVCLLSFFVWPSPLAELLMPLFYHRPESLPRTKINLWLTGASTAPRLLAEKLLLLLDAGI